MAELLSLNSLKAPSFPLRRRGQTPITKIQIVCLEYDFGLGAPPSKSPSFSESSPGLWKISGITERAQTAHRKYHFSFSPGVVETLYNGSCYI